MNAPPFIQGFPRLFGEQVVEKLTRQDSRYLLLSPANSSEIRRGRVIRNEVAPAGIKQTSLNF